MPIDYTHYPPNWHKVSAYVRQVIAQNRCQCMGDCGLHRTHPGPRRCEEVNGMPAKWARGRIVLTVAHLDAPGGICQCEELTGKKCAEIEHLRAFCQRCHLRYDHLRHQRHAAETRRQAKEAAGQLTFLSSCF